MEDGDDGRQREEIANGDGDGGDLAVWVKNRFAPFCETTAAKARCEPEQGKSISTRYSGGTQNNNGVLEKKKKKVAPTRRWSIKMQHFPHAAA